VVFLECTPSNSASLPVSELLYNFFACCTPNVFIEKYFFRRKSGYLSWKISDGISCNLSTSFSFKTIITINIYVSESKEKLAAISGVVIHIVL